MCSHSVVKLHETTEMFVMVDYVRKMAVKNPVSMANMDRLSIALLVLRSGLYILDHLCHHRDLLNCWAMFFLLIMRLVKSRLQQITKLKLACAGAGLTGQGRFLPRPYCPGHQPSSPATWRPDDTTGSGQSQVHDG